MGERLRKKNEERERLRKEKEERERLRKEKKKQERLRKEKKERLRKEKKEQQRLRKEKEEQERPKDAKNQENGEAIYENCFQISVWPLGLLLDVYPSDTLRSVQEEILKERGYKISRQ